MLLMFGKATVDTKGLPRVSVLNSHGRGDGTVYIVAKLESATRAAVEKWAKRLGVPVVEGDGHYADERQVSAEAESDGSQLSVYTYVPAAPADSDPGKFPWRVFAQPEDGERWMVNAFTTRELAQRFVQRRPHQYGPLTIERAEPTAEETGQVPPSAPTGSRYVESVDGGWVLERILLDDDADGGVS